MWVRIAVGFAVALVFRVTFALRDSVSHGDMGFQIALAIAGVLGVAMVAPGFFTRNNRDPNDWGDEIKEIGNRSKGEPGCEPEKVAGKNP